MNEKRPHLLTACIVLLVINAVITGVHYLLIYLKLIPIQGDLVRAMEFAAADTLVTTIPSFIGAYGLWHLKRWGWIVTMIASGGYLHGMLGLLTHSLMTSQYGAMNLISIYFILFSGVLIGYLWQQRKLFN